MKWKVTEIYCKKCGKLIRKFSVPALKDETVRKDDVCLACVAKSIVGR